HRVVDSLLQGWNIGRELCRYELGKLLVEPYLPFSTHEHLRVEVAQARYQLVSELGRYLLFGGPRYELVAELLVEVVVYDPAEDSHTHCAAYRTEELHGRRNDAYALYREGV